MILGAVFFHAGSRMLVALQRARGPSSPHHLHFIDLSTLQIIGSVAALAADRVQGFDELFLAGQLRDGVATWSIGRVDARRVECVATVTTRGTSASGDTTLLGLLPERVDVGSGFLAARENGEFRLRVFCLEQLLGSDEMPWVWRVTPDGRYAITWRVKGWPEWPVIDLDTCEIVNRVEGRGWNEPKLGFANDGSAHVGVHDQIHRLGSVHGQLTDGVRLKTDNSGSHIAQVAVESDGSLTLSWFGRGELPQMVGATNPEDLRAIEQAQDAFARSGVKVAHSGRYGRVLTFDPDIEAVTGAARLDDWGVDPIVIDDHAYVRSWNSPHNIERAKLEPTEWPTYPPRQPGDKMWF